MIPFLKMHGIGNDFVVLDARTRSLPPLDWQMLADRRMGIGCDQIVILEASPLADVCMRIINADGSEVSSCGNASRCVGWLIARESGNRNVRIETSAGVITAEVDSFQVTVDMGSPRLAWEEIPLAYEVDTLHLPLTHGELRDPVAVSMGNPHAVFFVEDVERVALEMVGPILEHDALFPQRANIGIAQIIAPDAIKLRVWERGSGLTLACGTGACAALVAAVRRGLAERRAQVFLPGGRLTIEWRENNHVFMQGEATLSFEGHFLPEKFHN